MRHHEWQTSLVCAALLSGCVLGPDRDPEPEVNQHVAALEQDVLWDFEDGTNEGFEAAWGDAFAEGQAGTEHATLDGQGALRVNVSFAGQDWEEANFQTWISGTPNTRFDLSAYHAVEYDLLVPLSQAFTGVLKLGLALNWDWQDIAAFSDLDLITAERIQIDGTEYARVHVTSSLDRAQATASGQLTIRLAAYRSHYVGPLYVDNVRILARDAHDAGTGADGGAGTEQPGDGAAIVFDFEDGTSQGFGVGWGTAFDVAGPSVEASDALTRTNNHGALRVNLAFNAGSWEEANTQTTILASGAAPMFGLYERLEYDVYLPTSPVFTGTLKLGTALNADWNEIGPYSDVDLRHATRVSLGGIEYYQIHRSIDQAALAQTGASRQLVLRFAASGSTYHGPVYVDDVRFVPISTPTLSIDQPRALDTVSGIIPVRARVFAPASAAVEEVFVTAPSGTKITLTQESPSVYVGQLDTSHLADGFAQLAFSVRANELTTTQSREVRVDNSGLSLTILAPTFDATVTGRLAIRAKLDASASGGVVQVGARIASLRTVLRRTASGEYVGTLNLNGLPDRVHTLVVEAQRAGRRTQTWTEVSIHHASKEGLVYRAGADFFVRGEKFYFLGTNTYDLPFKYESTLASHQKTITNGSDGERLEGVMPAGTLLTFEAQVDRTMIEVAKLGMSVVRTWAFNSDLGDAHAFYKADWTLSEPQLARLDYVVDSARRHGLRVILPFENYWDAYGGIAATTRRFGVPKLAFFSDPRCQRMYRDYIAAIVKRVNTVNGRSYRSDPTIFAWELMNEPRMGRSEDTSAGQSLFDPTGEKLGAWFEQTARYVKSLDPRHMVGTGAEGHGFAGWGGSDEGYGNDPLRVMDQPSIDFFTFHPYLNESWSRMTVGEAKTLITGFVKAGIARHKPVVMEEWGFNKHEPVLDLLAELVAPESARYDQVRTAWYELIGATLRREGGNANLVWMLQTNLQERNFGITLFSPYHQAATDRTLASGLANQAWYMKELGAADFVRDAPRGVNPWSGYIHEAVFLGLMPLDPWQRFWPDAPTTQRELRSVLEGVGLSAASVPERWALVTMDQAGQAVYDALGLSAWGSDVEAVLARFDLLPQDEHGRCVHRRVMTRAELASLALRISDFLLYQ